MKPRHAAALALWASRVLAVILFALPVALFEHRLDVRDLNWISSDPQALLRHEQLLHSHSIGQHLRGVFILGMMYIIAVELLSWGIRKVAMNASAKPGPSTAN
jgi:hypothetical protein